jgi:hypothetical protein
MLDEVTLNRDLRIFHFNFPAHADQTLLLKPVRNPV